MIHRLVALFNRFSDLFANDSWNEQWTGEFFSTDWNELIATTGSCACATDDLLLRRPIRYAARVHRGALKSQARKAAELLHNCASRRDKLLDSFDRSNALLPREWQAFHDAFAWNRNFQLAQLLFNAFTSLFVRNSVMYDSRRFDFKLFFLYFSFL